jgi:hypothetical protein
MKCLILLSLVAVLGTLPAAAGDEPVLLQASTQDIQPPEPSEPPPAQAPASTGQWVYTSEYGWVWMPYSSVYTYAPPDGSTPSMFVYYPDFGWCWLVAPWLWGLGPAPFFGVLGPGWYGWYGHGLGRWYGYQGRYRYWGSGGRAYWNGGRWVGVNRGRAGTFQGGYRSGSMVRGGSPSGSMMRGGSPSGPMARGGSPSGSVMRGGSRFGSVMRGGGFHGGSFARRP